MILAGVVSLIFCTCLITAVLFEGDNCTLEATNEEGQCIKIHECEYAEKLLREDKIPETCAFLRNIPLVCCPVKQNLVAAKPGQLAKEKCDEYQKLKEHKKHDDTITLYFGEKARSKEFPHMAAVGYAVHEKDILWLCGGTLISHYFVLSAAHCAFSAEFGLAKWIRLGDLDLKNTTDDANPQDIRINQIYVHPQYQVYSHYHDIALLKMEKYTYFSGSFKSACLQIEKNLPGNDLQATGFGNFDVFEEDTSAHLMKLNLSVVDHETCSRRYTAAANSRRLKKGIVDGTQICAGNAQGGDTCPGSSGGPLHYRVKPSNKFYEHFVVVGITSFGKGCGQEDSAGVYTRVSAYVGWIESIVWANNVDNV